MTYLDADSHPDLFVPHGFGDGEGTPRVKVPVLVPETGHAMHRLDPQLFADTVTEWVASIGLGGSR